MKKRSDIIFSQAIATIAIILFFFNGLCQPSAINRKKNPYSWMFGISWNIVDNNEEKLPNLFDVKGSWNYLLYPTRISIDKYARKGWSYEGMVAYNRYTDDKIINDTTGISGIFLSGDFHVKYSFYRFMTSAKWFDPYLSAGLGFSYHSPLERKMTPTVNLALGMNFWVTKSWGIQLQTIGKLALVSDIYVSKMDYFQYTAGVVYRKQPNKKRHNYHKKRHGWIDDKQRFKRKNT